MQYFIKIVDNNSFTKAAEELFISQSAISQQIKSLEEELGVSLMIREKRSFSLTPAGKYFYDQAKLIVKRVEDVRLNTIELGQDKDLSFVVGYLRDYIGQDLENAIAKFVEIYPEVKLTTVEGTHEELYQLLISQKIELIFNDQRRAFNEDYYNYELVFGNTYIEVSRNSPLAKYEKVDLDDLKDYQCVIISPLDYADNERYFYEYGLGFKSNYLIAQTLSQARMLVTSNQAYFPVFAIGKSEKPKTNIVRIPVYNNKPIVRKYCAFWDKERTSYYIEEFVEMLRQELKP